MRMWLPLVTLLVLVCVLPVRAQVSLTADDVPMTPGTITEFFLQTATDDIGIPVELGDPGANQFWDFVPDGPYDLQTEEIFVPNQTPYYDLFPDANRVTFGPVPFGLDDGDSWRYDQVTNDLWSVRGLTVYVDEIGGDFPVPLDLPLAPLPLNYGDSWSLDLYREVTVPVDQIPYPIPVFEEIRIELTLSGGNTVDAWGTVQLPGGEADALRVFTQVEGFADAIGIYYIFNIPIEVPLGTVYVIEPVFAYSWYAPDLGEVAFALSMDGETDPDFTHARIVRRQNLGDTPPMISVSATPTVEPVTIPAQGGSFDWTFGASSTYPITINGQAWTTATLPNGNDYPIQVVNITLQPNASIEVPGLMQAVPAMAPAGEYSFNVFLGRHPNLIGAEDSFPFTKLAAATAGAPVESWHDGGMLNLASEDHSTADPTTHTPDGFALSAAYPNPFNPTTSLSLTLPEAARVELTVHDALGRQVMTLANGRYFAGEHSFTVDGSGLASGVYFVNAHVPGHFADVRKIVLMK